MGITVTELSPALSYVDDNQLVDTALRIQETTQPAPERLPTTTEKVAKDLVTRAFNWLYSSPSNNSYYENENYLIPRDWLEARAADIQHNLESQLESFHTDNFDVDLWRIRSLKLEEPNDLATDPAINYPTDNQPYNGDYHGIPTDPIDRWRDAKLSYAYRIAYLGIQHIINMSRDESVTNEEKDRRSIEAIGASLIRCYYFDRLAEYALTQPSDQLVEDPDMATSEDFDNGVNAFEGMLKQNTLSIISKAAWYPYGRRFDYDFNQGRYRFPAPSSEATT